jgi:hypothetical protein
MKHERPEIEKTKLAGKVPLDQDIQNILEGVSGTVLDINGGVGRVSEYLSDRGCNVTLVDPNRLSFSYRKGIVPNSKVKCWNIEADTIKLNKPIYDYVIIRGLGYYDLAKTIAKKGVVNLITMELENVMHNSETVTSPSENSGVIKPDKESISNSVQPIVPESQTELPSVPGVEPLVDLE